MSFAAKQYIGALAVLFLAVPIWARPDSSRTLTASLTTNQSTKIGQTQIDPGDYTLKARESESTLDVVRDGKVVAQVSCHWIKLPQKAVSTEVDINNNQIVEVEFAGKTEAVQVQ